MTLRGSRRSGSSASESRPSSAARSWAKGASSAAGYLGPDRVRWRTMACGGLFCFQEQYCLFEMRCTRLLPSKKYCLVLFILLPRAVLFILLPWRVAAYFE
ncbi:hypothetical protein VPH35_035691 [Triticum aestivum]